MADRITPEHRSWNMSRIRSENTKPEIRVRKVLHRLGYRFRLHRTDLPGRPDIVLPGRKTVVFVHGCYWHRHEGCKNATTPNTRRDFWLRKFHANVMRDITVKKALEDLGLRVVIVWECETDSDELPQVVRGRIESDEA